MNGYLFCYGTLVQAAVIGRLIGRVPPSSLAKLPGYACYGVRAADYPAICAEPGGCVAGLVYKGVSALEFAVLDRYESDDYQRQYCLAVLANGQHIRVQTYVWRQGNKAQLSAKPWLQNPNSG